MFIALLSDFRIAQIYWIGVECSAGTDCGIVLINRFMLEVILLRCSGRCLET